MLTRLFLILSLGSLCLYLYGALTALTNVEENLCRMTYMYEYPQYVVSTALILLHTINHLLFIVL